MNSQAVAGAVDASAVVLTMDGAGVLSVATSMTVGSLVGDGGVLAGPGATTVTESLTGDLTVQGAVVEQWGQATSGRWALQDGSELRIHGDALLQPGADVETYPNLEGDPFSLFVVTESGSLTFDGADGWGAEVTGGFANHGTVTVASGNLLMMGTRGQGRPDEYSTGLFSAAPDATLVVAGTELRSGTRLENVQADSFLVPADHVVEASGSWLADWSWGMPDPGPSMGGAGEVVVTDDSTIGARIQDSLTVRVPEGEVLTFGGAVQDQARLVVEGEVHETGAAAVGSGLIDVRGTYVSTGGGSWGDWQLDLTDLGTFLVEPGATFLKDGPDFGGPLAEMENHGTVRVEGATWASTCRASPTLPPATSRRRAARPSSCTTSAVPARRWRSAQARA